MNNILFWLLLIFFTPFTSEAYVDQKVLEQVVPYLLPEDHPIKESLNALFSQSRATLSVKTMVTAGFENTKPRKWTHVVVTRHPLFPGYIFKIYLDTERYFKKQPEYEHWIRRVEGVEAVRKEIVLHGWESWFKAPKKWIYLLPEEPSPPKYFIRKNFILVEEDMELLPNTENLSAWKSKDVTEERLFAFFTLLETLGLHDCAKPDNAPFSYDGRIAFIDTESHRVWPVAYKKLNNSLSPEMCEYWKSLYR